MRLLKHIRCGATLGCGITLLASLSVIHAPAATAAIQVWDFDSSQQSFNRNRNGNRLRLTSTDGVRLTVTGWSDTRDRRSGDTIQSARLMWAETDALGLRNRDERGGARTQAIDSVTNDPTGEYDMLLLEFDEEVELNGFDLNAAFGGDVANTADISVLAWDQSGASALNGRTWNDVLAGNGGGYDSVGNYNNIGVNYFAMNTNNIRSSRWLIGVYNPIFGIGGTAGDDSFLLSMVRTNNNVITVSTPGSMALALLGILGLRRKATA